ncbi:hypothetical protein Tco_1363228 [Tanacetum coccineum]
MFPFSPSFGKLGPRLLPAVAVMLLKGHGNVFYSVEYKESALVYWHVEEAATGYSIPRRLNSPTSQATQLPELELTLTPATGRELSQEINNHSVPTLISQAPRPSQKRSRSPSKPSYPDATTFSDGKPASETPELNPEDVTAD